MTLTEIKKEVPSNVIRVHTNPAGNATEVIDLNINTNVTVSNTRSSKIFRRTLVFLVCVSAATFTIMLVNVKGELKTLQAQVHRMDSKIGMLMTKYEKVSSKLNRLRSQFSQDKFYESFTTPETEKHRHDRRSSSSEEQSIEIYKKLNDSGLIYTKHNSQDTNQSEFRTNSEQEVLNTEHRRNDSHLGAILNDSNTNTNASQASGTAFQLSNASNLTNRRFVRGNLTFEKKNLNPPNESQFSDYDSEGELLPWTESRTGRARRDDGRGKKRTKNERRPKRSRRRLAPLVATFIGGVPFQQVTHEGYIGPWVKRDKEESHYDLNKFYLDHERKSIEVTMKGLYMISTQIFYVGQHTHYSYVILLNSEGISPTRTLTKCSTVSNVAEEVSCHTSVVLPLQKGDRLRIQQQERNRSVDLREGLSYIQLVLLSGGTNRRRSE